MNRKRCLGGLFGVLLLVGTAMPATAITYGALDGTGHPNVGAIIAIDYPGQPHISVGCTGTLIGPDVLLTAGHCAAGVSWSIANGIERLVTFDPTITESSTFYEIEAVHADPAYSGYFSEFGQYGAANPADVGVVLLAESPIGITPAELPDAGLLDELKEAHLLGATTFTAVGYGDVRETNRLGFGGIADTLDRHLVGQTFMSLTDAWLRLSQNSATGDGGSCFGDSGGPHFISIGGVETNIVAAITALGDAPCIASEWDYRIDTDQVLAFLAGYVAG